MKGYWIGIISLMSCWAQLGYSQTINWGPAQERSSLFNEQQIAQASGEGIFVWQYYKNPQYYFKYKALYYDNDLSQKASAVPLEFWYQEQLGKYQDNTYKGNQWRFYYTIPQASKGKELLCWATINPKTLSIEQPQQLIVSADYNKAQGGSQYRIGQAPTDKTLLYGLLPQSRKQSGQLLLHTLDQAGKLMTSQQIETPQEAGLLMIEDVQDAFLTTTGTAYLLCKFYHNKSRKEEKKVGMPYHYALLTVDDQGQSAWQDSLTILSPEDSALVVSARLYQVPNQKDIYCVGSYKTPSKAGLFQWNIKAPTTAFVLPYPAALWQAQETRKSKKVGLKNHKIKQWLPQEDGSYLAIAEQQYTKVYWDKSEGQQALHQLHDILLMKWDAQGQLLWYHNIAKRQRGGGEGYTNRKENWYSFAAFEREGQIHVFYNDLLENKEVAPEDLKVGYYNQPKALDCWHYRLQAETGELIEAEPLEAPKDWLIYPQKIQLLSNGQVLLAALQPAVVVREKSLLRWGYLSLEETE